MLKGYLSIEVSDLKVRYLFFCKVDGGYRIFKAGVIAHSLNVLATGELTRILQDLIKKEELQPIRLYAALCLQENYIRLVNLPKMELPELQQAVRSEIEQHPSFNNRAFDYLHHASFYASDKGQVVFAAVEQNVLNYLLSECHSTGLPFSHLEISPMNVTEILHLIEPGVESQAVLVVNDQNCYLMVSWSREFRLIHLSSTGMEQLYPRHNDKISQPILIGLVGELKRALNSYLSQHRLEVIHKIWLLWDRKGAAGFDATLAGALAMDVEVLSLERLSKWVMDPDSQGANPIYVLAATPALIHLEKIKEKFAVGHFFRQEHVERYVFKLIAMAVLVLGFSGYFFGIKGYENSQKQRSLRMEITATKKAIDKLKKSQQRLENKNDEFIIAREILFAQAKYIKTSNKSDWSVPLAVFMKEMPKNLSLTAYKFKETGLVIFEGESLEAPTVSALISRINDSPELNQSEFEFFNESIIANQKVFHFGIQSKLDAEASWKNE